jgi:hypothetical protein|tara:strand:+ start:139 stop:522 length:384 start_codon:yes stop_codon:yes gene_type:complete
VESPKTIQTYTNPDEPIQTPGIQVSSENSQIQAFDIDKLALAVAWAETGNCTKGSAISHNNCFGIMTWHRGFRELKHYNSHEESFEDFKRIWLEKYDGHPSYYAAQRWTGNPKPDNWLKIVDFYYFN